MAIFSQSKQKVGQIKHMVDIFEFWCNVSRHAFLFCLFESIQVLPGHFFLGTMLDTWIDFDP